MGQVTQQELESRLWAAANSLRSLVDPADFKGYILPMLFLKRISDTWDHEFARALERYDGDTDLAALPENFRFQIPDGCHWLDLRATTENIGDAIQGVFDRIEIENQDTLAGIFGDANWGNKEKLSDASLSGLIAAFDALKLDPVSAPGDLIGGAYEYLLKQFADVSGTKSGEFFTPRSVVHLLTRILDPKPGESIYDPTCGSAGMLVESVHDASRREVDSRTLSLYGQEINPTTAAIARMNLYLHDIADAHIAQGDTLSTPRFLNPDGTLRQFEIVLANPPFSIDHWDQKGWANDPYGRNKYGTPPAAKADYAFIQHMLASIVDTAGRMAVVMSNGVLFRGGAEKLIRQAILDDGLVVCVIALPANLFYSTDIPVCVLVCAKEHRAELKDAVLFIDATRRFEKGKARNSMSDADIEAVISAYRTAQDPDGEDGVNVRVVPFSEIQKNDYSLAVGRYIKAAALEMAGLPETVAAYRDAAAAFCIAEADLFTELEAAGYVCGA